MYPTHTLLGPVHTDTKRSIFFREDSMFLDLDSTKLKFEPYASGFFTLKAFTSIELNPENL